VIVAQGRTGERPFDSTGEGEGEGEGGVGEGGGGGVEEKPFTLILF